MHLYEKTAYDVANQLEVSPQEGLSADQVAKRQAEFGPNAFEEQKRKAYFI